MIEAAIEAILAAGLSVYEHKNNSNDGKTTHISILGGKRRVEFYPTTGTVYANRTPDYPKLNVKNSSVERAIQEARQWPD